MDDYLSEYDSVDQMEDVTGGIRYMPIKKESVGKPDYQPLQHHNNSGKSLKNIQQNQKRIIAVVAALSLLLLLVVVVGSTLVSISWSKLNAKGESDFFQKCKQETTSCTLRLTSRRIFILPNCTTEGVIVHMKVSRTKLVSYEI